jgi:hypothetical protein
MGNATWELLYDRVKPKRVRYVRSIVSYIDVLGFRELIRTKTAGEISQILRILGESTKPDAIFKSQRIQFVKFSDTVIRSMPEEINRPRNLLWELRGILQAQLALIPKGILIRGAVTVGEIVRSWGRVYGPAVLRAYDLESADGSPPRIVVDEEALRLLVPALEKEEGLKDELDGLVTIEGSTKFLDYLGACEAELNVPEQEYPLFLELHRDLIRNGLARYVDSPKVLSKYEWLKNYHSRTVKSYARRLKEHFGIDVTKRFEV